MASNARKTCYLWSEWYFWHDSGTVNGFTRDKSIQPLVNWENPETKRRFHNLLVVSKLFNKLQHRHLHDNHPDVVEMILKCHTKAYLDHVMSFKDDGGIVGEEAHCAAPHGVDIILKSASGALECVDEVLTGRATNAYALIRPPGHHAEPDKAMGFCFLNNIAIAARYAQAKYSVRKVAIVDFDVHHGNGTQKIFWEDPSVLFISIHQDSNYPIGTGLATERGEGPGHGFTINVPLPPGSGRGAYAAVTEQVVVPALDAFIPDLILASSGFDASYLDPLSSMMASSEDFRNITRKLVTAAAKHCAGRLIFMHEGGYSEVYVPYCGLAVVEALSGIESGVKDPMLEDVYNRGYQELQPHQDLVIQRSAAFVKDIAP